MPGDAEEAVLGHHLGGVERLGEGELLVLVADAVAPRQRQVLDQQAALRVHDQALGHVVRRLLAEPLEPEVDEPLSGRVVGRLVDRDGRAAERDEPAGVEGGRIARLDARPHRALRDARPAAGPLRDELDHGAPVRARDGSQPDEADQVAGAEAANREGLLPVAGARGVHVPGLEDRQEPVGERRGGQPCQARPVALVPARADEDLHARPLGGLGEDLAAVGDVQRDHVRAADAERLGERQVVDPRGGQRLRLRAGEEERLEQPPHRAVGRSVRPRDQRVAPDVLLRAQCPVHAARVGRAQRLARAGRPLCGRRRRGGARHEDRGESSDEEREPHGAPILPCSAALYQRNDLRSRGKGHQRS